MIRIPIATSAFSVLLASLPAQAMTWTSVPPGFERMPGNGALAMPLRWSQGVMQVQCDKTILPTQLLGQSLRALRVRRPGFVGEPAYPALNVRLKVALGVAIGAANQMSSTLATNRPQKLTVVAGPLDYSVPATNPHAPGDATGAWLVDLPFATPYVVPQLAEPLFLEWEVLGSSYVIHDLHWVDALYSPGGSTQGFVATVGNGGCGPAASGLPMRLLPDSATPPAIGQKFTLRLENAKPSSQAFVVLNLHASDTFFTLTPYAPGSFGVDLAPLGMPGCWSWTGFDTFWSLKTSAQGDLAHVIELPNASYLRGVRSGVQAFVAATGVNPAGFAASNGLYLAPDRSGVVGFAGSVATVLCPGPACTLSPWIAWVQTAPILLFGY